MIIELNISTFILIQKSGFKINFRVCTFVYKDIDIKHLIFCDNIRYAPNNSPLSELKPFFYCPNYLLLLLVRYQTK
jgi:hypothetical protein